MRTITGIRHLAPAPRGSAVTIGTFDGVHLGHRALIARTRAAASTGGLDSAVVTWDRHPFEVLRPKDVPPLLSSPERKAELIEAAGADTLAVLEFDADLSSWPPEQFVQQVLIEGLRARVVVVGRGWRFGRGAAGDAGLLRRLGAQGGFEVEELDLALESGEPVSSSRVRAAVASGDLEQARDLLGRAFDVDGRVVKGDGRGTGLGFPTANIDVDRRFARPSQGVYAGRGRVGEVWYAAAINVGVNLTFGGDTHATPVRIEAFLLDFDGDIYGAPIRVEFWRRLRDERKFGSVGELVEQIAADVAATRALTC